MVNWGRVGAGFSPECDVGAQQTNTFILRHFQCGLCVGVEM